MFFIVFFLIAAFMYLATFGISSQYGDITTSYIRGVSEIRWGIDIRGGVDVTFTAPEEFKESVTDSQVDSAKAIIETRLVNNHITDYEVYADYTSKRIIVRFPWQADNEDFDPESAVKELGETAMLTFREGYEVDDEGLPTGQTETVILEGKDVKQAAVVVNTESNTYEVSLEFNSEGAEKFADATGRLVGDSISIWMDDFCFSAPTVNQRIEGGSASISQPNGFELTEAQELANKINGGALPFKLEIDNFSTISPTLGAGARDAMAIAGMIAFLLISVFMIIYYRLPGFVAVIALFGQVAGMFAAVTGFFAFNSSFTLTIPGIAGIILSIGMGVDANVISAERIKEELSTGKTIDGSIHSGFERGFAAILDSNLTVVIVAIILMGAFGTSDSLCAKLLTPVFFMFGPTTAGTIYSFGYTLLVGVIMNFIMGCTATRLMLTSISKFKVFRKPFWYGGANNVK